MLSTTHKIDDFYGIPFANEGVIEGSPLDDHQIVLYRDATRVDGERLQQSCHSDRRWNLMSIAVQCNRHETR